MVATADEVRGERAEMENTDQRPGLRIAETQRRRQGREQQVEDCVRPVDGAVAEADESDGNVFPERESGQTFGERHGYSGLLLRCRLD